MKFEAPGHDPCRQRPRLQRHRRAIQHARATAFLRQAMVDATASIGRTGNAEIEERRARLERTEDRIRNLIDFISRGESIPVHPRWRSPTSASRPSRRRTRSRTSRRPQPAPYQLPTPGMILDVWTKFERIAQHDPLQTREALRLLLAFAGQGLRAKPQPDGRYMAEGQVDLFALFRLDRSSAGADSRADKTPKAPKGLLGRWSDVSSSSEGCAGGDGRAVYRGFLGV